MDGARGYHAKLNKSVRERQIIPYGFTCMWNLRNKTNKQRGKERERESKPRNRLLTTENTLKVSIEEVGGGMGEVGDGDYRGHSW